MNPAPFDCPIPGSQGFVPATGPIDAPLLLVGEAAGFTEAVKGEPFHPTAPAGSLLMRILSAVGLQREEVRIGNVVACHPPNDWLVDSPWEGRALAHCRSSLEALLGEPHRVVVPVGATATRAVLSLVRDRGKEGAKLQNFHGTVNPCPNYPSLVVPTFHPSFLLQGGQKFSKTLGYDLTVAKDLAAGRIVADDPTLVCDPDLGWFERWCNDYLAHADEYWLAVDIETPDKGDDEAELVGGSGSAQILRINLAWDPAHGVTLPWSGPYQAIVARMLGSEGPKVLWNETFDLPRLRANGVTVAGPHHDAMNMWHVLQADLPRGLGFVAPFYSHTPAWKHLGTGSLTYCAMDGVMTLRAAYGIAEDLQKEGMWDVYMRHCYAYDSIVLRPAEEVGIRFDASQLAEFTDGLRRREEDLLGRVRGLVPVEVLGLSKPYVRPQPDAICINECISTRFCETCGTPGVVARHKCKVGEAAVVIKEMELPRYYKRLPFKPSSWQQVLRYIKFKKHRPGRHKKTKKDTTDKKTLQRLVKTGDPIYPLILEHRMVAKMAGTYGEGMLKRIDKEGRVHPNFGHVPSTMRLNCTNPNMQNIAAHSDLADGFRRCVVAGEG